MKPYEELIDELKTHKSFNEEESENVKSFIMFLEAFKDFSYDRNNLIGHISASALILNKEHTKVLMAFHNIYQAFTWLGGHADNDMDLTYVAKKEILEESGLSDVHPLNDGKIVDVAVLEVSGHEKRGKFVPCHLHYNVTYVFDADENAPVQISEGENSAIEWVNVDQVISHGETRNMKAAYERIFKKLKLI